MNDDEMTKRYKHYCHTCGTMIGSIRYTTDYNFCSRECINKYNKKSTKEIDKKEILKEKIN